MTVEQLLANISSREISEWMAFFRVENERYEQEKETSTKNAEAEARARKQGR